MCESQLGNVGQRQERTAFDRLFKIMARLESIVACVNNCSRVSDNGKVAYECRIIIDRLFETMAIMEDIVACINHRSKISDSDRNVLLSDNGQNRQSVLCVNHCSGPSERLLRDNGKNRHETARVNHFLRASDRLLCRQSCKDGVKVVNHRL